MPDGADAAAPRGIDPRGPRFAAAITSALLLGVVFLGLTGLSAAHVIGWSGSPPDGVDFAFVAGRTPWAIAIASPLQRLLDPASLLLLAVALLFLWSVVSPRTAPWRVLYRRVVAPRLSPPSELEDPRPPLFAQGVGLSVSVIGLVLHLVGVPWAIVIAAAVAFAAAFLNAVFGLCLGCRLYLLLQRAGVVGRPRPASA